MSPEARRAWEQRARDPKASFWRDGSVHDTVCAIAMDAKGDLASAVSTSGLAGKLAGRVGVDPTRACQEILERMLKQCPEVRSDPGAQLAFIAMNKAGEVGAAALRLTKKPFRYALSRGLKVAPALVDVKPML